MAKDKGAKGFGKKWNKNQERAKGFSPVPAGWYSCQIDKAEIKPTKGKDGRFVTVHFKVLKGDYKGRIIFENYNFDNPNQQAEEIAHGHLASICDAIGIEFTDLKSPEQMKGKLDIQVSITPGENGYAPKNKVNSYDEFKKGGGDAKAKDETDDEPDNDKGSKSDKKDKKGKKDKSGKSGKDGKKGKKKPWDDD